MAPADAIAPPSFPKVVLSFVLGLSLGGAIVFPAIRQDVTHVSLGSGGSVANMILLGILSLVVVTSGLFALFRLFVLGRP